METVIRDVIHGDIVITDPLITRLIDTKEFQRLRNIKQLSTASITFPGAEHTPKSIKILTFLMTCLMTTLSTLVQKFTSTTVMAVLKNSLTVPLLSKALQLKFMAINASSSHVKT